MYLKDMQNTVINIPGLGEKTKEALKRLNITSHSDLMLHFPSNIIHKSLYQPIHTLKSGDLAILKVKIVAVDQISHIKNTRRKPFKIHCSNETGHLQLIFFSYHPQYLMKWAKIGSELIVTGKIDFYSTSKHMAHPEIIDPTKNFIPLKDNEVVYPLTYGILSKQLYKYISYVIEKILPHEEWIDQDLIEKFEWCTFKDSIKRIHNPSNANDITPYSKEHQRLAYDELLATQLTVNLLRKFKEQQTGRPIISQKLLAQEFIKQLPFELTNSQILAIKEISKDQQSNRRMSRLLQGDVGSGKTVVAISALLNTVETGAQAVLMAPTDILANQHFVTLEKLLINLPIKFALLTGKTKAKERARIMEELNNGKIQILVGTHAVFQDKVNFHDLALVVIDEQHRFGVEQRLSLVNKGKNADLLIMSATPIPRSLSLALYGDMDITRISEKPKSRIAITTSIMPSSKLGSIIESLDNIIQNQGKIYWICPLVNESEDPDLKSNKTAAETRMQSLEKVYPGNVGLAHGQLDNNSKQESLNKFANGELRILVATTVVEVGVDVPDATVIIIENAESFGLSQLHQLRGRVGRGDKASHCILLYNPPIGNISWQRLKIIKDNDDGFILAEEDLKLRGGGDLAGIKQSGLPNFKVVDFIAHHQLISLANSQAKRILLEDPELSLVSNQKYHELLKIFGFNYKRLDW